MASTVSTKCCRLMWYAVPLNCKDANRKGPANVDTITRVSNFKHLKFQSSI